MDLERTVSRALDFSAVRGIMLIVLGIAAIAFPVAASITTSYVVGWVMIVAGLAHLLSAWRSDRVSSAIWTVVVGLVYGFVGYQIITHPSWGVATIALAISAALAVEGVVLVVLYFMREGTSGWVLFNGIIAVALAAIIASGWPSSSLWMVGTIVGINLLVSGVSGVATWMEGEKLKRRLRES